VILVWVFTLGCPELRSNEVIHIVPIFKDNRQSIRVIALFPRVKFSHRLSSYPAEQKAAIQGGVSHVGQFPPPDGSPRIYIGRFETISGIYNDSTAMLAGVGRQLIPRY
jgi:hypothetical protein